MGLRHLLLAALAIIVLTGASAKRELKGNYYNHFITTSAHGAPVGFDSTARGATATAADWKGIHYLGIRNGSGTDVSVSLFSTAIPGNAGFRGVAATDSVTVIVDAGAAYVSEGVEIYALMLLTTPSGGTGTVYFDGWD